MAHRSRQEARPEASREDGDASLLRVWSEQGEVAKVAHLARREEASGVAAIQAITEASCSCLPSLPSLGALPSISSTAFTTASLLVTSCDQESAHGSPLCGAGPPDPAPSASGPGLRPPLSFAMSSSSLPHPSSPTAELTPSRPSPLPGLPPVCRSETFHAPFLRGRPAVFSFPPCPPSPRFFVEQQLPPPPHEASDPPQLQKECEARPLPSPGGCASPTGGTNGSGPPSFWTEENAEVPGCSRNHVAADDDRPRASNGEPSPDRDGDVVDTCDPLLSNFRVLEEGFVYPLPFCPPSEFLWQRTEADQRQDFGDSFPSVYHGDTEIYRHLLQRHFSMRTKTGPVEDEGVPADLQEEYLDFTPAVSFDSTVLSPVDFRDRVRRVDEALRQLDVPPPPQLHPLRFEKFAEHARRRGCYAELRCSRGSRRRTTAVENEGGAGRQAERGEREEDAERAGDASGHEGSRLGDEGEDKKRGPRGRLRERIPARLGDSESSPRPVLPPSPPASYSSCRSSCLSDGDSVSCCRDSDTSCSSRPSPKSLASYFGFFLCAGVRVPCPVEAIAWCVTRELYSWHKKLDPSVRSSLLENLKHSRAKRFNRFACRISWPPLTALCPYSEPNIKAAYKEVIPLRTYQLVQNLYRSRFNRQTNLHNFAVDQHAIKQKTLALKEADENAKSRQAGGGDESKLSPGKRKTPDQGQDRVRVSDFHDPGSASSASVLLRSGCDSSVSPPSSGPLFPSPRTVFSRVQADEIVISVAVYHPTKGTKLASFDLLSSQSLLDLRDALLGCCESEFQPGVPLFPGSCFVIDGIIYPDTRYTSSTSEYADILVEHLRYSGKLARKKRVTSSGNACVPRRHLQSIEASRGRASCTYEPNTVARSGEHSRLRATSEVCTGSQGPRTREGRQILERRREVVQDKHTGKRVEREICIFVEPPHKRLDGTLRTEEAEVGLTTPVQYGQARVGSPESADLSPAYLTLSRSDAEDDYEAEEDGDEFVLIPQDEAVFDGMRLPLRSPACFLHQGSCEHRVVFWNFRQFDPKRDCTFSGAYPIRTYKPALKTIACRACEQSLASKGVANSVLCSVYNPTFLCDSCYSLLFGGKLQKPVARGGTEEDERLRKQRINFDGRSSAEGQNQDQVNIRWCEAEQADEYDPFSVHFDLFDG